jgi:hypothetical protein
MSHSFSGLIQAFEDISEKSWQEELIENQHDYERVTENLVICTCVSYTELLQVIV